MLIVRTEPDETCTHCANFNGPWTRCIQAQNTGGLVSACANCHWDRMDKRCDFYRMPTTRPAFDQTAISQPGIAQEGRSSQEQPRPASTAQKECLDQIISHVVNMASGHREQMTGIQQLVGEILNSLQNPQVGVDPFHGYDQGDTERRLSHQIHESYISGQFLTLLNMLVEFRAAT